MNKNFKKFITFSLAIGTLASTTYTFAMKPAFPLTKRAISETLPELTSCVREFESIAPGVFYVDPYFKGPENKEPQITCTILKQVIKIFKQYPNITQKFIEQTHLTREKKFEIKPLNAETLKTFTLGIEINGRPPTGHYIVSENAIQLFISTDPEVLESNYRPEGNVPRHIQLHTKWGISSAL